MPKITQEQITKAIGPKVKHDIDRITRFDLYGLEKANQQLIEEVSYLTEGIGNLHNAISDLKDAIEQLAESVEALKEGK